MSDTPFIFEWTGREADALRASLRMTNEQFAEHLDVSVRTVASWRGNPGMVPRASCQELLDGAYAMAARNQQVMQRFVYALTHGTNGPRTGAPATTHPIVMAAEMTLMQARIDELQAQLEKERQS